MTRPLRAFAATVFYCVVVSTALRGAKRGSCGAALLLVLWLAFPSAKATAGVYKVAMCQADKLSFNTRAFTEFAHRRMIIKRACNRTGEGMRGLIISNRMRSGRIKRGSIAELTFVAPQGTRMTNLSWSGQFGRSDCRFALQMWADGGLGRKVLENAGANRRCSSRNLFQSLYRKPSDYSLPNSTRIVQRVVCVGDKRRNWCSGRYLNYIRTNEATVTLVDDVAPTVEVLQDTPLANGAWVRGQQPLNYSAADNIGVQSARVLLGGRERGLHSRVCVLADLAGPFADPLPCPNGPGQMVVKTQELDLEGTQQLFVEAQDAAGNRAPSAAVTARIDNTPPARVDVGVEGGDGWRNHNEWAAIWTNPSEGDRAPIVAANYELCAAGTETCSNGILNAHNVSRLALTVPRPGEWELSMWRTDAAGNGEADNASVPVILRYDPDPPQLAFEPPDASDPTQVAVRVTDPVSGLAGGAIEIGATQTGVWRTLSTEKDGDRLVARIDDAALPAGTYVLRARARDLAGNEASTDRRDDGQPMVVTLPLRTPVLLRAGFETVIRRLGRRRQASVLRPTSRLDFGERTRIKGRLVTAQGRPLAGALVQVLTTTGAAPEQPAETLTTDADGRFTSLVTGTSSRTIRLAYTGSSLTLPAQRTLDLRVPAATTVRVNRRRVLNGQRVQFSGRVRGVPVPAAGKLVEVQVRFSNGWQTFRTTRSDQSGRWSSRYRFQRTHGLQRYQFRIRLPREGGYPFETGVSRKLVVEVRGS